MYLYQTHTPLFNLLDKIKPPILQNASIDNNTLMRLPQITSNILQYSFKNYHNSMNILQVQNQLSVLNSPVIKDLFENYRNSMNILQIQNQLSVFNSSAIKDLFMSYKNSMDLIQAQRPFQDVINQLKSPTFQSYLQNNIHNCINAQKPFFDIIKTMKSPTFQFPLQDFWNSMNSIQTQRQFHTYFQNLNYPFFQDHLKRIHNSLKNIQPPSSVSELLNLLSSENWAFDSDELLNLKIDNNNELISNGVESVNRKQLQDMVYHVIVNSINENFLSLEEAINSIINAINSLNDLFHQKVIKLFIFPILVGLVLAVISPFCDYYVKKHLSLNNGDKRIIINYSIKMIADQVENISLINTFRIVTANTLNVRKNNLNKSQKIGVLYFGDIVEVLTNKRKWSLVRYCNKESDILLQGWVFSRYLKAIIY